MLACGTLPKAPFFWFLIHIDAQDFQETIGLYSRTSADLHCIIAEVNFTVQERPVLVILCILCIDVQFMVLLN